MNPPTTAARDRQRAQDATSKMRAIVQRAYGSSETLTLAEIDRPRPGPGEVLLRVHAAGVDRGVWHLMTGIPYLVRLAGFGLTRPKNSVPGMDVAGTVVAVGEGVDDLAVGDEVFGIARGAYAEYAIADASKLVPKPATVGFEEAATATISGITALQALTDVGRVEAGQRVLVIGASGGVGSFAVQLAKALGANVNGVASGPKMDLVRSLGADHVIDYTTEDYLDGRRRYDLIVDTGGRNPLRRLRRALEPEGTLVIVGGEGGNRITGGVGRQVRAAALSPFVRQRFAMFMSSEKRTHIEELARRLASGEVTSAVGRRYALADVPAAIDDLTAGVAFGKSVVVIHGEEAPDAR